MNIKSLEYYHKLVQEKNFSKVAAYFDVSQPTITLAIKRLEAEYQTTFFIRDRSHKELVVTDMGYQFDQHIISILNELEIAAKEIKRGSEQKILFGLPPIIGNYYFPKFTPALLKAGVMEQLETFEGGSTDMLSHLLRGNIDLALLGSLEPIKQSKLKVIQLASNPFKIIVSKQHPLANKGAVAFSDLKKEKFIDFSQGFVHTTALKQLAKAANIRTKIIYQTNDLHIIKALVAQNIGIGFLTDLAILPSDELVALDILDEGQPTFITSLASRTNHILTEQQAAVFKVFQDNQY